MKTFRDSTGREWLIAINAAAYKRCRDLAGVDLYGLADDGFRGVGGLLQDPPKLVDVLFCLCKREADERGVTDEAFGESMDGDALEAAGRAFVEELIDFFREPLKTGLRKAIEATRKVEAKVTERIESLDLDSLVNQLTGSSGNVPGSSESTPARLRSVS